MFNRIKKAVSSIQKKWWPGGYPATISLSRFFGWWGSGTQWQYQTYALAGYMNNPVVHRCVSFCAESVSGVPFKLYKKGTDDKDVHIEQAPILDLLNRPNPFMSQKEFFSYFVSYLEISGNTYIREVGPNTPKAPPKELYFINPQYVIIESGDCGLDVCPEEFWGLIYTYRCGKEQQRIDLRKLYHGKYFNPICPYYGCSPLQSCASSVDALNEALVWNTNLLRNSAAPSLLVHSESTMSDDQIARYKEQLGVNDQGPWNSGRPIVSSGDIKVERIGMSPKDMDWIEGINQSAKFISLAFGLDPQLGSADAKARSFNTYRDAEKSFYMGKVLPTLDLIRDSFLNRWLIPRFYGENSGYYFNYDLNAIEVLSETQGEVFNRLINAVSAGVITINEAREELGYSELDHDGGGGSGIQESEISDKDESQ